MLTNRTRKVVVLCAILYIGYLGTLIGLKIFYFGDYEMYLQAALVYVAFAVVAFIDRKFELI